MAKRDCCKMCASAFLQLTGRGLVVVGKIKCEIDGKLKDDRDVCKRFSSVAADSTLLEAVQ